MSSSDPILSLDNENKRINEEIDRLAGLRKSNCEKIRELQGGLINGYSIVSLSKTEREQNDKGYRRGFVQSLAFAIDDIYDLIDRHGCDFCKVVYQSAFWWVNSRTKLNDWQFGISEKRNPPRLTKSVIDEFLDTQKD